MIRCTPSWLFLIGAFCALSVLLGGQAAANPVITSSNVSFAEAGASTLTITGRGFDPIATHNIVAFSNGAVGTVTIATTTQLTITFSTLPAPGRLTAIVTTNGQSSGAPATVATVEPVVQFNASSETINAVAGSFSIAVGVAGNPSFATGASGTISNLGYAYGDNGLAMDGAGNFYVGAYDGLEFETVDKVTPGGASTGYYYGTTSPNALIFDAAGNLYISSEFGTVTKVTPDGAYNTFAQGLDDPDGMAFDAAGNLYVANYSGNSVSKVTPAGVVSTFASGFYYPRSLAVDGAGNVYVGNNDQNYNGIVSMVTPAGVVSTFVSGLSSPYPGALAFDSTGNLYITDNTPTGGVVRMVTPGGVMSIVASGFNFPSGLVFDSVENLYVLSEDEYYDPIISEVTPTVTVPLTLGGTAVAGNDYSGVTSPLTITAGQTTANITGTLIPDPGAAQTLTITLGTPNGALLGTPTVNTLTISEPAASVTPNTASLLINAPSIVIAGSFNPVVANNQVTFNDGAVGTVTNATASALTVTFTTPPTGLGSLTATVLTNGTSTGAPVQVATVVPAVTSTTSVAALGATSFTITGAGFDPLAANNTVTFNNGAVGTVMVATPTQLTVTLTTAPTSTGPLMAIVTTDGFSSGAAVPIAVVEPIVQFSVGSESVNATNGTFSIAVTLTGNPTYADGLPPTALNFASGVTSPNFVTFDSAGNLYVDDSFAGAVSKTTSSGGTVSSFATGFTNPAGLAVDSASNLYVASVDANGHGIVSKVTPAGAVSTFASGFYGPEGLAFDAAGNLYVANFADGTVSEVTPGGVVSTFASGFNGPFGLAFDTAGNLYVSTNNDGLVSKVTPGGAISTFASGFGDALGLAFDNAGNLYVAHTPGYPIIGRFGGTAPDGIVIIGEEPEANGVISEVTPAGVVSTFVSQLYSPNGMVCDPAGNLYVAEVNYNYGEYGGYGTGTVEEYSPTLTVPFTFNGTAVSGVDYSEVSNSSGGYLSSTLTFVSGRPTLSITGTLIPDAGVQPALTFTLGTPTGAVLGTPATNTLTILEPSPSITASTASLPINASSIVLNGNFSPVAANNTVTFNHGAVGTVTSATSTSLTVTFSTPPQSLHALTASVTSNGVSSGTPVTVATVVPGVTASSSTVNLGVTTLTINGFGFDPDATKDSVILSNNVVGTVVSATATKLTVHLVIPPTKTGNIYATVITDGLSSVLPVAVATVAPSVQFSAGSESIDATNGTFSIPVTLTGNPTFDGGANPAISTVASGNTFASLYSDAIACDSKGNLYIANFNNGVVSKITPGGVITTFASGFTNPCSIAFGPGGSLFLADNGTGKISKITSSGAVSTYLSGYPDLENLAFDSAGNLYVAYIDANNNGVISKVTPVKTVTTFATGFNYMAGMAFDAAGNLYVANADGGPLYRVTPQGVVSTFGSWVDSTGGLAIDAAGNIYVSGYDDNAIYKVTPGGVVSTLASGLYEPQGLAFDTAGNLCVVDENYYTGTISKLIPTAIVPFTIGGTGAAGQDYSGVTASPLVFVKGQTTAHITGTLMLDPGAAETLIFKLGQPSGAVLGNPSTNTLHIVEPVPSVTSSTAKLAINAPAIVINGFFNPVVAKSKVTFNDGAIGTVTSASVTSLTVTFTTPPVGLGDLKATVVTDGLGTGGPIQVATVVPGLTTAETIFSPGNNTLTINGFGFDPVAAHNSVTLSNGAVGTVTVATPTQLTIHLTTAPKSTGTLTAIVTTDGNSSGTPVAIAVIDPVAQFSVGSESVNAATGAFSVTVTLSGNSSFAGGASSTMSTLASGFSEPSALAIDKAGNLYVANSGSNSVMKIAPGGSVSTFASGFTGEVTCLAFNAAGNLYVGCYNFSYATYTYNSTVSKVTPGGVITPFASGFVYPSGMVFDAAGNLYVADDRFYATGNVSKVTPGGAVSILASGFNYPAGLAIDPAGNLYVSSLYPNTISKVTPLGAISTFASGFSESASLASDAFGNLYVLDGDVKMVTSRGVVSTLASGLEDPEGLAIDTAGNLYVSDYDSNVVEEISPTVVIPFTLGGTAVAGIDYGGVTAGPLTFGTGQRTAYITGTLTPDLSATPALTFTLGTPTGAVLGNTATNTLTIVEPPASVTANAAGLPINAPTIMINGVFNPVAANNTVTFNNGVAGTVTSASATALTVTFTNPPASLGKLTATVLTNGLSTGAPVQVATVVPGVSTMAGGVALNAPTVTINGFGFDSIAAHNTVTFNDGAVGKVALATATQLTVNFTTAPKHTGALTAIVTTDGFSSAVVQIGLVQPLVQFSAGSETVNAATGTFSIPVTLTGAPTFLSGASVAESIFASGLGSPESLAFDSAGNLYVCDNGFGNVYKVTPAGVVTTFAAGFSYPVSLAFDSAGNLYVADRYPGSVSKVTPAGVVSTVASTSADELGGLAIDAAGNLYISEIYNGTINKITPGGVMSIFVSGLSYPSDMVFDAAGNLYVSNSNALVSKVTPGGVVSTFASGFEYVAGMTFDSAGNLYVADGDANTISQVTPGGIVSTFAAYSYPYLYEPGGLAFDAAGNLYVTADYDSVTELSPSVAVPFTVGGTAVADVDYTVAASPVTLTSGQPTAYITGTLTTDPGSNLTLTFTLGTPTGAVLGNPATNTLTIGEPPPSVTSSAVALAINAPSIVINGSFNLEANSTVAFNNGAAGTVTNASATALTVTFTAPPTSPGSLTATVTSGGVSSGTPVQVATVIPVVTSMSSAISPGTTTLTINGFGFDSIASNNTVTLGDGAVGTVMSATPTQLIVTITTPPANTGSLTATVTVDGQSSGTAVQVALVLPTAQFDVASESVQASGLTFSIAVTLTGSPTFVGGAGPMIEDFASGFNGVQGLACDAAGNVYVSNPSGNTVSKVTPAGVVSTFASGFNNPYGLAFDSAGNLYVANSQGTGLDQVTPTGGVSNIDPSIFSSTGLAFDSTGNLFVAGFFSPTGLNNGRVQAGVAKVTSTGTVSTFVYFTSANNLACDPAGNLYYANSGGIFDLIAFGSSITKVTPDGTSSTFASGFAEPTGLAFDTGGDLYVADAQAGTVSVVTSAGNVTTLVSGFINPAGLAFDNAGNLYVANSGNNIVSKMSPTATVPYTVSGTAVAGVDYAGLTASPLTFVNGQPTVYITGTLIPNAGASKTLTFTLGTPTGAVLGSTTVNTLTILQQSSASSVATPAVISRNPAQSASMDVGQILASVADPDPTNTFALVATGPGSHGTTQLTSADGGKTGTVIYTPNAGYAGVDTFTYTAQGKSGAVVSNTVTVTVAASNPTWTDIVNVAVQPDSSVALVLAGIPNTTYGLQYRATLASPAWTDMGTVTTNSSGAALYMDGQHPGTSGFYRLVYPAP